MSTEVTVNSIGDALTPVGVSQLGTIVFDNVLFPAGVWIDLNNVEQSYPELKLDSVSLRVNRMKDIVKTKVVGLAGKVKEYTTVDDYQIEINAIFAPSSINPAEIEPVDQLNSFAKLELVEESVSVRSKALNNTFNITQVVIESFDMSRFAADSWQIVINAISDQPIDLSSFG